MYYAIITVHVVICFFLIIIVLLQSGKAADLAGAFGGMGSQTAFGPRGSATVLSKATTIAAVLFMVTSIVLSITAMRRGGGESSVLERHTPVGKTIPAKAPATPAGTADVPGAPGQPIDIRVEPGQQGQAPAQAPPPHQAPAQGHSAPAPGHSAPAPGHSAPAPEHSAPAKK